MATLRDYVELAGHAYESMVGGPAPPLDWYIDPAMVCNDGPLWSYGKDLSSSGLQCRVYIRAKTKEAVIAYKGTKLTMMSDVWADIGLSVYIVPVQMTDALNNTKEWREKLKVKGIRQVTLVGHSLGGGIAQYVGSETGLRFVTFNAPGMLANTSGICASPFTMQNIQKGLNYIMTGDVVGNFGRHIGDTVRIKKVGVLKTAAFAAAGSALAGPVGGTVGALVAEHLMAGFRAYLDVGDPKFKPDQELLA